MNKFLQSYIDKNGSLGRLQYLGRGMLMGLILNAFYLINPGIYLLGIMAAFYFQHWLVQQRLRDIGYGCSTRSTVLWQISFILLIPGWILLLTPTQPKSSA